MGRDTSIYKEDRGCYYKLQEAKHNLYKLEDLDWCEEYDLVIANELVDEIDCICYDKSEEVAYWGKSNCSNIVKFFREYKTEDGDFIITKDILEILIDELSDEFTENQISDMLNTINDKYSILVYNTNG